MNVWSIYQETAHTPGVTDLTLKHRGLTRSILCCNAEMKDESKNINLRWKVMKTRHMKQFWHYRWLNICISWTVKLNPPTNVTVKYGSDQNLWFYWNQTHKKCVESEVRYRKKQMKWEVVFCFGVFGLPVVFSCHHSVVLFLQHSRVFTDKSYCINLPSNNSRYELQVRNKLDGGCGGAPDYWSEWSEPAIWGSNNSTGMTAR